MWLPSLACHLHFPSDLLTLPWGEAIYSSISLTGLIGTQALRLQVVTICHKQTRSFTFHLDKSNLLIEMATPITM